ncbi:MAG: alpha/beta hydrolase family protein [Pirellulales bacterium]
MNNPIRTRSTALAIHLCAGCLSIAATYAAEGVPAKEYYPPDAAGMPAYTLPDVLQTNDAHPVTTADQWRQVRRTEVLELFRKHVYGRVPVTAYQTRFDMVKRDPNTMGGAATLKQVDVVIRRGGKSLAIHLVLFVPNRAPKPVPTFLLICNRPADNFDPTRKIKSEFWPAEEVIARGYGIAAFFVDDVDPDRADGFKDGAHGLLDDRPRTPDAWGTLAAWAWGASRVMDYFQTDPDIARDKVVVLGHSRGGKTALWAAAEDERFAMAVSNDSGCGGASLSRRKFVGRESVARINRSFPHWFCGNFKSYNDREDTLPVDQHMLISLVAPRAVYVASADKDLWADPRGEFLSVIHAAPVYRLLGKQGMGTAEMPPIGQPAQGDAMAYHIRTGGHGLTVFDWQRFMDFADKTFGRNAGQPRR